MLQIIKWYYIYTLYTIFYQYLAVMSIIRIITPAILCVNILAYI